MSTGRAVCAALAGLVTTSVVAPAAASARVDAAPALVFEANRGQADVGVRFLARGEGYTALLTARGLVLALGTARVALRVTPVGGEPAPSIVPEEPLPGLVRYHDGAKSVVASTFGRVAYRGVYPGIDLVFHGGRRRLEYDFVVAPGADPSRIALAIEGGDRLSLEADGTLVAHTATGMLRQPPPVVYQEIGGARRPVDGGYRIDEAGRVRFRLGPWDRTRALVVDPLLTYATYLGGTADDSEVLYQGGAKVAVDAAGNVYVAGTTPSVDFPTTNTPGAERSSHGRLDVFVSKFGPTGTLLYSTYLGGPCDDVARDVAADAAGNAYVTGRVHGGANCYADVTSGVLVAKLDPAGGLVWASEFGGSLADDSVGEAIAVDATGQTYVAGVANSASHDFPTTPGAFGTSECANVYSFAGDAFVAKLSADGTTLLYSRILCGQGDDSPSGIAIDASGVAYVVGSTGSSDFPTVQALQPTRRNGSVAVTGFAAALAADGSHLLYSTYLGGSGNDWLQDVAVDAQGNAYVTGETESDDFPTTPGVLQEHAGNRHCLVTCTDAFVSKVAPDGSALVYSTYLAGDLDDSGSSIAVDGQGQAYVVGTTISSFFPVRDAFQPVGRTVADAFVTKLAADGSRLLYSSYFGGSHSGTGLRNGWDAGWGVALDPSGNAWLAGYTQSYDLPVAGNPFQAHIADGGIYDVYGNVQGDVFVAKVAAGGPGVAPPVPVTVTPAETRPGSTVTAAWSGNPMPAPDDSLQLFALGAPFGDPRDVSAWWWTGGTTAGALMLALPADLPAGWYELRLVGRTASDSLAAVVGRSEAFRIAGMPAPTTTTSSTPTTSVTATSTTLGGATTTTVPPPTCEGGAAACDDGDPCTVDGCAPGHGCTSAAADGFASVTCTCARPLPAACAGETVPGTVTGKQARACGLLTTAARTSDRGLARRRLKKAAAQLARSIRALSRARSHGLSAGCGAALDAALRDARDRARRLLTPSPTSGAS